MLNSPKGKNPPFSIFSPDSLISLWLSGVLLFSEILQCDILMDKDNVLDSTSVAAPRPPPPCNAITGPGAPVFGLRSGPTGRWISTPLLIVPIVGCLIDAKELEN